MDFHMGVLDFKHVRENENENENENEAVGQFAKAA